VTRRGGRHGLLVASTFILILAAPAVQYLALGQAGFESQLTIITPFTVTMTERVKSQFVAFMERTYGFKPELRFIIQGSPVAYGRIIEWAGKPDADVFWGGDLIFYKGLTERGLLAAYKSPYFDEIPGEFNGIPTKDPNFHWATASIWASGILVHNQAAARYNLPMPESWEDLLKPVYRGHIVATTPARSSTMHSTVQMILQLKGDEEGWAFLRRLAANIARFAGRSVEAFELVQKGEYAIGLAIPDPLAVSAVVAGQPVTYIYPNPTYFILAPVALLKGAKSPNLAKVFIDFLLTREGQIAQVSAWLTPVRKDIRLDAIPGKEAEVLRTLLKANSIWESPISKFRMDEEAASRRLAEVNKLFDDTITNVHDTLKSAWVALEDARNNLAAMESLIAQARANNRDVREAEDALKAARTRLEAAMKLFEQGSYAQASSEAGQVRAEAARISELVEKAPRNIPFYENPLVLGGAAGILLAIVLGITVTRRRAKIAPQR
jgi:iron(III) transport system substrate-binding protein